MAPDQKSVVDARMDGCIMATGHTLAQRTTAVASFDVASVWVDLL